MGKTGEENLGKKFKQQDSNKRIPQSSYQILNVGARD